MVLQKLSAAGKFNGNEDRAIFVALHALPAVIPSYFFL
jgi:hypothetical protein